jgi:hypothetical protein
MTIGRRLQSGIPQSLQSLRANALVDYASEERRSALLVATLMHG